MKIIQHELEWERLAAAVQMIENRGKTNEWRPRQQVRTHHAVCRTQTVKYAGAEQRGLKEVTVV